MEFPRTSYLNKLIASVGSDQVKVVTGVRRCGKSYLLNSIFRRHLKAQGVSDSHIIEMDFDGYKNRAYRDPATFLSFVGECMQDVAHYFLLLDEVQLLDHFVEVLNDLIRMDNVDVYVTGSNARLLSRDVVTEFRGRGEEIAMRPLSFSEFMEVRGGDKRDGYMEYAMYGGLPAAVLREGAERKTTYLAGIFQETYIADILERYNVRNRGDFDDVVEVLSSSIGCLTNPTKIANTFKSQKQVALSRDTVERYIEHLTDSFLFERAVRYDIKGRKYIGTDAKYYSVDMGLRNARMNFRQFEETHILENVIYNELRGRGFGVDVGVVPAWRKDKEGKSQRVQYEVDFVCNSGGRRYYIQSAFALPTQSKIDQEQASLLRIDDSFKKIIITKEGFEPHYDNNGILTMNVYDFLLNRSSLEQ